MIRINSFGGMAPGMSPVLKPIGTAGNAVNCSLASGAIRPWFSSAQSNSTVMTGALKSIFRYDTTSGSYWLSFATDTDFALCPVAQDAFNRLYFASAGSLPRYIVDYADEHQFILGADLPGGIPYTLGIPAAAEAPGLSQPTGTGDALLQESRIYVTTFVSAYGEEGPPSPPSGLVNLNFGETITITKPPTPAGNYNISHWNLYRTNTGSASTQFQFVAQVDMTSATFLDDIASADLDEVLGTVTWTPPPEDMLGLTSMPNGMLAGFVGNMLCFCEPYQPHAWPYQQAVEHEIVALGAFGSSLLVVTLGLPYVMTGQHPSSMGMERLEVGFSCTSKRSVVDLGTAIVYASPVGMVQVGVGGAEVVTRDLFPQQEDWQEYAPETIVGYNYGGRYVGFYDNGTVKGGFVLESSSFTLLDFYATAGWYDQAAGKLFLVLENDTNIYEFNGGTAKLSLVWRSSPIYLPAPASYGAAVVKALAYPVTLNLYADGSVTPFFSSSILSAKPFRLPAVTAQQTLEIEFIGSNSVIDVQIAKSISELRVV